MSYELFKDSSGKFHFNLKAGNGEVILTSQAYTERESALGGIESVRVNGPKEDRFERRTSATGQPYFVLLAPNSQVIGHSQMYSSAEGRDGGIASVQKNCASSTVQEAE